MRCKQKHEHEEENKRPVDHDPQRMRASHSPEVVLKCKGKLNSINWGEKEGFKYGYVHFPEFGAFLFIYGRKPTKTNSFRLFVAPS